VLPVRVQTCTTLVIASEPYKVLCAPRINSKWSASGRGRVSKIKTAYPAY